MPLLHGLVFPVTLRGMAAKGWIRSSVREARRLTEDRRSLVERYMIDAAEAQARAQRAADEQAMRRAEVAKGAAEEQAKRAAMEAKRAAEEQARRAAKEAKRAAEEQAKRAAMEAKQAARADKEAKRAAGERARRAAKEAKRAARAEGAATCTPPAAEPVADLSVAAFQPDELPAAAPRAAEIAEPREQEELTDETSLPIYGWFDAPALRKEVLEPDAFSLGRRAGSR